MSSHTLLCLIIGVRERQIKCIREKITKISENGEGEEYF